MTTHDLHQDIAFDLLPLYLAGEASAATRQWIEARMASDPSFAQLVESAGKLRLPGPPPPAHDREMEAFQRTRRRMVRHHVLLVMSVLLTLLFAVSMGFLLDTHPQAGAVSFLLGSVSWLAVWLTGRDPS